MAAHRPLVKQIARRILRRMPPSVGFDEMEQSGLIGLNEALLRFEDGRGSSFESYAARRIEGSMLDTLRKTDTLSRESRTRVKALREAVRRLEHSLCRAPRAKEVANELAWPLDAVHQCMVDAGAAGVRTGDEMLENREDDSTIWGRDSENLTSVDEHGDPLDGLQQRQRHAALNAAFDALEASERYVMESIYKHGLAMRVIGETLGVSESRVSRIASEIVSKLRLRLRDW